MKKVIVILLITAVLVGCGNGNFGGSEIKKDSVIVVDSLEEAIDSVDVADSLK
jgi:hypothetical protein